MQFKAKDKLLPKRSILRFFLLYVVFIGSGPVYWCRDCGFLQRGVRPRECRTANSVAEGKCCHGNHYSGAVDAMRGREGELGCERHLYA